MRHSSKALPLALLALAEAQVYSVTNDANNPGTVTSYYSTCPTDSTYTVTGATTQTYCPGEQCTSLPSSVTAVAPQSTVWTTTIDYLCPTGLAQHEVTITEPCPCMDEAAKTSGYIPSGWTTTEAPCSVCGEGTSTVTLMTPCESASAEATGGSGSGSPGSNTGASGSISPGSGSDSGSPGSNTGAPGSISSGSGSGSGSSPAPGGSSPASGGSGSGSSSPGSGSGAGSPAGANALPYGLPGGSGIAAGNGSYSDAAGSSAGSSFPSGMTPSTGGASTDRVAGIFLTFVTFLCAYAAWQL